MFILVKDVLKKSKLIKMAYTKMVELTRAFFPKFSAKYEYLIAYGHCCNLDNPVTFSEKLLWLSLNTYKDNPLIMQLCDKYLVRDFVCERTGSNYLNELYSVYNSIENINFDELPKSFALKVSQGCTTNIFCENKEAYDRKDFYKILTKWKKSQYLYDRCIANVGGIAVKDLKKFYICEKLLKEKGKKSPTDYKIYCFNGEPKAILVITDRFENITGAFMSTRWDYLSGLTGSKYHKTQMEFKKPQSLETMLDVARKLSHGFPFVRVDMYDIDGKAIFGEMTFFPNGCIHMQETLIDGKTMGELLDISYLL